MTVIDLHGRHTYHPDLTTITCQHIAGARQRLGLSLAEFTDVLAAMLNWTPTAESVRSWETDVPPPGDVVIAVDLATGHRLDGIETGGPLATVTPSLLADALTGPWLTAYQFTPSQDRSEVKVHADVAHVAATQSGRAIVARNYPPGPRTEGHSSPFRNEIKVQLANRHLVGTWKNTSDARYFGSLHLAVLPGETVMDGYYTGLSSDIEVALGRWKWIRLDPDTLSDVNLEHATLRDPQELHALVMGHTQYDRPLPLTAALEG